jgi:hypothetical protein
MPGIEQYYLTSGHSEYSGVESFDELLSTTFDSIRVPVLEESCAAADLLEKSIARPCVRVPLACCRARDS